MKENEKKLHDEEEKIMGNEAPITEEDVNGYALCSTHKQTACQFDCIGGTAVLSTSH